MYVWFFVTDTQEFHFNVFFELLSFRKTRKLHVNPKKILTFCGRKNQVSSRRRLSCYVRDVGVSAREEIGRQAICVDSHARSGRWRRHGARGRRRDARDRGVGGQGEDGREASARSVLPHYKFNLTNGSENLETMEYMKCGRVYHAVVETRGWSRRQYCQGRSIFSGKRNAAYAGAKGRSAESGPPPGTGAASGKTRCWHDKKSRAER